MEASKSKFFKALKVTEISDGEIKNCRVDGGNLAIAFIDGKPYAFEDRCPHWGVKLSDGCVEDGLVRCRAHSWLHDVAKGRVVKSVPAGREGERIACFETKIEEGYIWVSRNRVD